MEETKRFVAANEVVKPTCDKDWLRVSKVWHHAKDSSRPDRDPKNLKKKFLELTSEDDTSRKENSTLRDRRV